MNAQNTAKVIALVASVLNLPESSVGPEASMENLSNWDSLAHLNICLGFEERFHVTMDIETIASSTSIAKLASLLLN
jgi:acyl carrier protein